MFQRSRLLRECPWDAQSLAEEIYAMLDPAIPLTHEAPITINIPASSPALNLPAIIVKGGTVQAPTVIQTKPAPAQQQQGSGGGGGGFPCRVNSGGPGDTYSCSVYLKGLSQPPSTITVKQMDIDPAETIPAGTWTSASLQTDGQYVMQVPVWN